MKRVSKESVEWLVVVGAIFGGALIFSFGRGSLPKPGQSSVVAVTVVPEDAAKLSCASDVVLGERRCGFNAEFKPVESQRPLRPLVTLGGELILLSGVWESPEVAAWVGDSLKRGIRARVTLRCQTKILGTVAKAWSRWAPNEGFKPEQGLLAVDVENCVVQR